MKVEVRRVDNVVVVDFRGRLVSGIGVELLSEVMNELLAEGYKKILLNLSEVPRIDSAGIGELVASVKLAKRFECTTKVWLAGGRVLDVLELSQILPALNVYMDEQSALASFTASGDEDEDGDEDGG